ncbi:MAG: hypothetical protein LJE57_02235 [Gallionella sp.]|nr:hypothetical protein [Gallionella sp.]
MNISNDAEFKSALKKLPDVSQRLVAALFAENVLALSKDHRLKTAIDLAKRANIANDELATAFRSANAVSVDSYTQCGHDCNWISQASHFVAQSVLAGLKPPQPGESPAWEAAMHARMARTCEHIANGDGTDNVEAAAQYRILAEFLNN